jgi:hypothetical protein
MPARFSYAGLLFTKGAGLFFCGSYCAALLSPLPGQMTFPFKNVESAGINEGRNGFPDRNVKFIDHRFADNRRNSVEHQGSRIGKNAI